jgi:membrane-associated protease RseP (regulator of RpoE activity)
MTWNTWKKLIIASGALTCLVLCSAASPAAVPADDETAPAVVEEKDKVLVKVEEIRTDGETKVKVKVVADGDGEHMVHWVGSPAKRGYLGVALNPLSAELQKHFGAPAGSGVLVGTVVEGSPAQAAGLKVGDVITAIDGTNVASATDVQRIIREKVEGETAAIALVRGGAPMTVEATVGLKEMQEFDIGLLGDIGDLKEKAFFISSGMEGGNMVFETIDGDVTVDLEDQMENLENVFIQKLGDADDMIYFDTETFNDSMKEVHQYLASPEFQEKMKALQEQELDLQQRLEELELKLEKLEEVHEDQ